MPNHIPLEDYSKEAKSPVFRLVAKPTFAPVDLNLKFLAEDGWSASTDRIRFYIQQEQRAQPEHPLAKLIGSVPPHLLIRRYDREEDCLAVLRIFLDGTIEILSNDSEFATRHLQGMFLECPPSFHAADELSTAEDWLTDPTIIATFTGLVVSALGWDSHHSIPPALEHSLDEARRALEIANYRSCVVMCRRSLEALLKFAFPRLLGRDPLDNRGHTLSLNSMIQEFRNAAKIPVHLLHIADSLRVLGNVPGAHAAEIEGYRFSRYDAEFAIGAIGYFVDQYFSKIDTEVGQYYTLTIDLSEHELESTKEA
jgi:HEPN domain-containing protein